MHWHIKGIRSGKYFHTLFHLAHRSISKGNSTYQVHNWNNLIKPYGFRIATATRDGWIVFWHTYQPELAQSTDGIEVGLAGIRAELTQNPQLLHNLSDADAELMTRYAIHSLNNYPDWLSSLAEVKPKSVQTIVNQCIDIEWQTPASNPQYYGTISRFQYSPSIIQNLAIQHLQVKLKDSVPEHPRVLSTVLEILLLNPNSNKVFLAIIATERLKHLSFDEPSFINWLSLLLQTDGMQGVNFLEQELNKPEVNAKDLVLNLAAHLDPRHGSSKLVNRNSSYKSAKCLRRLIPVVYKYIQISGDTDRSKDGVYSPKKRDYAQSFRGELLP